NVKSSRLSNMYYIRMGKICSLLNLKMELLFKGNILSLILSNDSSIKLGKRSEHSKYSIHFRNVFHNDVLVKKYLYCITCKKLISHYDRSTHSLSRHCLSHNSKRQVSKIIAETNSHLQSETLGDLSTKMKDRFRIEKIYNFLKRNDKWHALVKWRGHGANKSSFIPVDELFKYWDSSSIKCAPVRSLNEVDGKHLAPKKTHLSFLQKQTLNSLQSHISKGI
ncbi:MAG: hypothetical protein FD188_3402, partial [Ignavibacteria bacterium]